MRSATKLEIANIHSVEKTRVAVICSVASVKMGDTIK